MSAAVFMDRRVWVTGAGSGIGRAAARAFHQQGGQVLGLDRCFDGSDLAPYETQLLDLTQPAAVSSLCRQRLPAGERIDVLVHAAGLLRMGCSDELSPDDWHQSLQVNASAAFHLFQGLVPHFKRQGQGAIVVLGSNAAHVPRLGMAAYCASKAALRSLSQCVALELAPHGVRCNLVSPGTTRTPMLQAMGLDEPGLQRTIQGLPGQYKLGIPLGKIAEPADVVDAILFMASPAAGHITLHDLVVDGGASLGA
ncbi:2,3-dihydro-2,3-dihydroxybenzoate dehydrogenase [Mitsuaria sp. WAJ17]|uniref:2,3-dihydro-2,3-dihydroxybenzoate dehydrogenase n=1 Tax=Mitsuaria sp. WAJ17 TaxID=2761452 RepID=UPI0016043C0D|nr:2,3-dihydro-2,3-dihydroxybenzoate dehydrogenase [Mitsuaria sp. WAJ17]MBB2485944.1 2,3-dihydro-2,3-dihydroxybenzoate dehydrogenase [Mitsuaria sp. WAJ17]